MTKTPRKKDKAADEPAFDRIELQAPFDWVAELDRVAKMMGLSRSAYIRQACNLKMAQDKKAMGE